MPVPQLERSSGFSGVGGGALSAERMLHGTGVDFSQHFFDSVRGLRDKYFPNFPDIEPADVHMVPVVFSGRDLSGEPAKAIVIGGNGCLTNSPDAPIIIKRSEWGDIAVDLSKVVKDWNIDFLFEMKRPTYDPVSNSYNYNLVDGNDKTLPLSAGERKTGAANRLCIFADASGYDPTLPTYKWYPDAVDIVGIQTGPEDIKTVSPAKPKPPAAPGTGASTTIFKSPQGPSAEQTAKDPASDLASRLRKDPQGAMGQISDTVKTFADCTRDLSPVPHVDKIAFLKGAGTPVGVRVEDRQITFEFMHFNALGFLYSGDKSIQTLLKFFNPSINNWITMTVLKNGMIKARINGTADKDLPALEAALGKPQVFARLFMELQREGTIPTRESTPSIAKRPNSQPVYEAPIPFGSHKNMGKETKLEMKGWRGKMRQSRIKEKKPGQWDNPRRHRH